MTTQTPQKFADLEVGREFQLPQRRAVSGWGRCRKYNDRAFTSGDQFLHKPHDLIFDVTVYLRAEGGLDAPVKPPTRREGWA